MWRCRLGFQGTDVSMTLCRGGICHRQGCRTQESGVSSERGLYRWLPLGTHRTGLVAAIHKAGSAGLRSTKIILCRVACTKFDLPMLISQLKAVDEATGRACE
jgi:hypothetical protein